MLKQTKELYQPNAMLKPCLDSESKIKKQRRHFGIKPEDLNMGCKLDNNTELNFLVVIMVLWGYEREYLILKINMLKPLGTMCHNVCNIISSASSQKVCVCIHIIYSSMRGIK